MRDLHNEENKRILLYGAASIGILSKGYFERAGFEIDGYIDQRSDEITEFLGKPVWGIDDCILDKKMTDDYAVYVSVKNVFEHSNIVNKLVRRGFQNIIYRPLAAINGIGNERQLTLYYTYDLVEQEEFDKIELIPKTLEVDRIEAKNYGLLLDDEYTVVCLVSLDMLHTDKKVRKTLWFDKPVMAELPHIDFFRYVAGESGYSCARYMKFCEDSAKTTNKIEITDAWRRNVIRNRASVYSHMAQSMEINSAFFQKNAANAIWDKDHGVFNLNSGKHRAAFYASKKRKFIPIRMSKDDYLSFINEEAVKAVENYFIKNGIVETDYPIPHPFYYDYPCENREFAYNALYLFVYEIAVDMYESEGELRFDQLRVYSSLHDDGFVERCLLKAGCDVQVAGSEFEKEYLGLLDKLCYSDVATHVTEFNVFEKIDYMLIDGRIGVDVSKACSLVKEFGCRKCFLILEKEKSQLLMERKIVDARVGLSSILYGRETDVLIIGEMDRELERV